MSSLVLACFLNQPACHYLDIPFHLDLPSLIMERWENNRKNAEPRNDAKKQFPIRNCLSLA
jgi:hypothetical protein